MRIGPSATALVIGTASIAVAVVTIVAAVFTGRPVDAAHDDSYLLMRQVYASVLKSTEDKALSRAEIVDYDFVVRAYNEQFDLSRFARARTPATVSSMEAMVVLLLTGGYLGLLPDHYAQDWVARGQLKRVHSEEFGYDSPHMLITAAAAKAPVAVSTFISLIDAYVAEVPAVSG